MASARSPRHLRRGARSTDPAAPGDSSGLPPPPPPPPGGTGGTGRAELGRASVEFLADLCAAAVTSPAAPGDPVARRVTGVLLSLLAERAPDDRLVDAVLPFWVGPVDLRTYRTGELEPVDEGRAISLAAAIRRLDAAPAGSFDVAEIVWRPVTGGEHAILHHDGEQLSYDFADHGDAETADFGDVGGLLPGSQGVPLASPPRAGAGRADSSAIADAVASRVVAAIQADPRLDRVADAVARLTMGDRE